MKILWSYFKQISALVARFQSTIILSTVYFLFSPVMIVVRGLVKKDTPGWQNWHLKNDTLDELRQEG